ncbi:MAG: aldehyde dehydrogenase family protein [bacterium]
MTPTRTAVAVDRDAAAVPSVNPATGRAIGAFTPTLCSELPTVLAKSRSAFEQWSGLSLETRLELFNKAYLEFYAHREELASLISEETGKPLAEAYSSEILPVLDCFKYYGKHARKLLNEQNIRALNPLLKLRRGYVRYEPLGVVAVISPWNYPFLLAMQHIVPALLAGNVVIHKPSEYTTLTGLEIREIFDRAYLPRNVLTVVTGFADVGQALVAAKVDKIFFTGSTSVGRKIYQSAAQNLVPVNMELGGSDPMIVLEDAYLERAVNGALWGAFSNAGQTCVSVERLYVHETIFEPFVEQLVQKAHGLRPSRGEQTEGDVASLNNELQFQKIQALVKDAAGKGAMVRLGGNTRPDHTGLYFPPTILTNVDDSMDIARQEVFGPVLSVMPFASDEEAVALANDSEFGLSATIWTRDLKRGQRLAARIQSGAVLINEVLAHLAQFEAPYTGYKSSGLGVSHGPWGMMEMVHPKYISTDRKVMPSLLRFIYKPLAENDVWWFKYSKRLVQDLKTFILLLHGPSFWTRLRALPAATKALFRKTYL